MITGTVLNRRAYVPLVVRGPGGQEGEAEFVLDSGFTGVTTLPPGACAALALPWLRFQPSYLADGTQIMLDLYVATLLWDGIERAVEVLAMDGTPLLGMTLLDGYDVFMQVGEGGMVTIERR